MFIPLTYRTLRSSIVGLGPVSVVICVLFSAASAQESSCKLKLSLINGIKEFQGLKLGMTVEEVRSIVPILAVPPPDEFGLAKTSFSPDFAEKLDKAAFAGIRTVSLEFVDGRLSSIWVGYNNSFKWKTADSALEGLTLELKLPDLWEVKVREKQLACQDFKIGISTVAGGASVRIADETARQTWQARRDAKEDEQP